MADPRADKFADQETLVRHLAGVVRARLAGADSAGQLIVGREPTELIALGVLDPRDNMPPLPGRADLPDEPGVPVDILPPSEMGLTIWVDPPEDDERVCFDVTATFAVYLPIHPTWEQQTNWLRGTGGVDREDETSSTTDDDDVIVGDDQVGQPTQAPLGGGIAPIVQAPHTAGRTVPLAPVYRRHVVEASFPVCVRGDGTIASDSGEIQDKLGAVVADARADRLAVELQGRSKRGVSTQAVDGGSESFEAELVSRATGVLPALPAVEFLTSALPDPRGGWRINLTLANTATAASRREKPAQTIYDAGFSAQLTSGTMKNLGYRLADFNWRIDPQVYAHGRFCVGEVDAMRTTVRTTTWPIHRDRVFESRPESQPTFKELIASPIETLEAIAARMDDFAAEWADFARSGTLSTQRAQATCEAQLELFRDEAARFRRGIGLLQTDPRLRDAFVWANEAFLLLNTPGGLNPDRVPGDSPPTISSWRLFQIVFIVLGLASLAAREANDAGLDAELDVAEVLWFPTGGGKSEAFLGLIAVALFFDRLRGKHVGVSAMLRFPLRMLSVQQLERVMRVVIACEAIRLRRLAEGRHLGDPFELGYFVGRFNTPNTLTNPTDDRWGDIAAMANWSDEEKAKRVVITACPFCGASAVTLDPDVANVRLHHRCQTCGRRIPAVVTDDEVFRTLPAVVVATVDKLAAIAFQPHFSHFTHGPAYRCPDHGYVSFAKGPTGQRRCLARTRCTRGTDEWMPVQAYDPGPALIVQDELHLLSEELGTLAAHYETLFAHLCRSGSGRAPKVITATATISDYENQIHQLYAKVPRRFPTEGFRDGETFYAARSDLPRRLFIGALPSHFDTAQFGMAAASAWREGLEALRARPAAELVGELGLQHYRTADEVADLLFRYELQLFYANRKNDAERIHEQMRRAGDRGPAFFDADLLTGDTPLADISAAIRRVDGESLISSPDPRDRLAAIAGTSLVSHGVDLARLNVMHVAGMPSSNAYYVQATARAGRADVGALFVAFSRSFARDRAAFHFFEPQHEYANDLVEAVSLNRFAVNGPKKTATGVLSALIINGLARDGVLNPAVGNEIMNLSLTDSCKPWLARQTGQFDDDLLEQVKEAYGLNAAVLDPVVADYFADAVARQVRAELDNLRAGTRVTIQKCFLNKPPSSFRDIDEPVDFGGHGFWSRKDFETLTRRDPRMAPGSEVQPADEEEDGD